MSDVFNKETLIPVGLVITLLAAALSFGIMYEKVRALEAQVATLQGQMSLANSKLDTLIGRVTVSKN